MAAELFETLRTYDGAPALLDAHLARLGAADAAELSGRVIERLKDETDDVVVRIVAGAVEIRPLPPTVPGPVGVTTAEVPGYSYPQKSTERAVHDRLREAAAPDTFEVLILDNGEVIEGTITNIFALHGTTLTTPPLGRCLPGVTRAALMELAPGLGLEVRQEPLRIDALRDADEVLLSNSVRGVVRVGSIDATPTRAHNPALAQQLSAALLEHYRSRR